jgi:hypothetical protein
MTRPVKTSGGSKTAGIDDRLKARCLGLEKGAEIRSLLGPSMETLRLTGRVFWLSVRLRFVVRERHRIEALPAGQRSGYHDLVHTKSSINFGRHDDSETSPSSSHESHLFIGEVYAKSVDATILVEVPDCLSLEVVLVAPGGAGIHLTTICAEI